MSTMCRPHWLPACGFLLAAILFLACDPGSEADGPVEEVGGYQVDPHAPPPPPATPEEIPEPPKWGPAGRLDPASLGHTYTNAAVGVSVTKPAGWVWLPATSMPDFASRRERLPADEVVPEEWADPIQTPLIAMASRPDPQWGRDAVVLLQVRPLVGPPGLLANLSTDPVRMAGASVLQRGTQHQGFAIVEDAAPVALSGLEGATIRIRYEVGLSDGTLLPTSERVWHARRDRLFVYLNAILPEDAGPEVQATIGEIHDSLRIDP
jgi:hypothetical protein